MGFGCKGLSQTEQKTVKPIRLNYWTVYNDVDQLKELANAYTAGRPHVSISIRKVRPDEFEKLLTNALADDVAPDIVSIPVKELKKYQKRLSVMPASVQVSNLQVTGQYIKETQVLTQTNNLPSLNAIKSNYITTVNNDITKGGTVYGLPISVDTLALYYNKDIFDKANIPEPPKTWDEFVEAVKKTTKVDANGNIIQSGVALGTGKNIDNSFDVLSLFMMQGGVSMANGSVVTFANGLDKPLAGNFTIKALDFYTDFARPTKEVYTWNKKQENALTSFVRGKTAMYFGFAFDLPTIKSRGANINLGIIPVPQLSMDVPVNVANYYVESVVEKSKNKNDAWDFVRFVTAPENVKKYTDKTLRLSPYRVHIKDQQENISLKPFTEQILNIKNWYQGTNYQSAKQALDNLVELYVEPYEGELPIEKYKASLINNASRIIQQTM